MNEQIPQPEAPRSVWVYIGWGILIAAGLTFVVLAIRDVGFSSLVLKKDAWARATVWVGVACTLGILSVLYRENPVFRFFEHVFLGIAAGYGIQVIISEIIIPKWAVPFFGQHQWYWIFAPLVGFMFYFVYFKRYAWIARWAMAIYIGAGAGLTLMNFVTVYMPQVKSSIKPIVGIDPATHHFIIYWNYLIMFITLITVMSYFFFSIEHKRPAISYSAKTGRWLLMIAFGAIFGNTVMARVSLLISRIQFLWVDWIRHGLQ
jgi:hypothetical protein